MTARAVDDAAARLRELRHAQWERLGLAALALGLAVAAVGLLPRLAGPLFVGASVMFVLGLRALVRHADLVDALADEPEAYVIPEVLEYASREATMKRRHDFAVMLRTRQRLPRVAREVKAAGAGEDLRALVAELEDWSLALDPACAIACRRLVDLAETPLLDRAPRTDGLLSRLRRIRSGFSRRDGLAA